MEWVLGYTTVFCNYQGETETCIFSQTDRCLFLA